MTLDEDVAAGLKQIMRERGVTFKQAINDALRRGLGRQPESRRYEVPVHRLGVRPGIDLDKALALAGSLEDEELARKLELNK